MILIFIITVAILSALIVISIKVTSSKKDKQAKNEALENYKNFIVRNGIKNSKSISFENIVRVDIDAKKKLFSAYSYYTNESVILNFSEILDFEVFENGSSIISSKTGSAIAGGLLFGELGAIAGASGSRTIQEECTTLKLKIYTSNIQHSVITLDFLDNSIEKSGIFSYLYEELNDVIKQIISFLKIAMEEKRQAERKEDKNVIVEDANDLKSNSNLGSLKELAELKEKGIITEKEFEESKQKILSKL